MATFRTDEGERISFIQVELVVDGNILAVVDLGTNEEDELNIIVKRIEDDPVVNLTVL